MCFSLNTHSSHLGISHYTVIYDGLLIFWFISFLWVGENLKIKILNYISLYFMWSCSLHFSNLILPNNETTDTVPISDNFFTLSFNLMCRLDLP